MLLTIDVGNTNIVITVFSGKEHEKIEFVSRINTDSARMSDQYAIMLMDIFKLYEIEKTEISGAIISSVVPPVTAQLIKAVETLFSVVPMVVGPGLKTGINIKIDDPSSLGGDLACGAVAARYNYPLPCLVIDMGTVTKIMAINSEGALVGGVFCPGVKMGLVALANSTASLPLVSAEKCSSILATNAVDSISAGTLYGTASMLDGMISRFEKELGPCSVVATGGHAAQIKPYCEREFSLNPNLVSEGLRIIYKKNR